jgi:hypothetical protein
MVRLPHAPYYLSSEDKQLGSIGIEGLPPDGVFRPSVPAATKTLGPERWYWVKPVSSPRVAQKREQRQSRSGGCEEGQKIPLFLHVNPASHFFFYSLLSPFHTRAQECLLSATGAEGETRRSSKRPKPQSPKIELATTLN